MKPIINESPERVLNEAADRIIHTAEGIEVIPLEMRMAAMNAQAVEIGFHLGMYGELPPKYRREEQQ